MFDASAGINFFPLFIVCVVSFKFVLVIPKAVRTGLGCNDIFFSVSYYIILQSL